MKKQSRQIQMGERYNRLHDQGMKVAEAEKIVASEFNWNGKPHSIHVYGLRAKKLAEAKSNPSSGRRGKGARKRKPSDHQEPEHVSTPEQIPCQQLDDHIRALAREVFQDILHEIKAASTAVTEPGDFPPKPQTIKGNGKKGRRENRQYVKASVTVDKVLWEKFAEEKDRLRISTGRLMDAILWRHYGRPAVSYQTEDEGE